MVLDAFPPSTARALQHLKELGVDFAVLGDDALVSPALGTLLTDAELDGVYAVSAGVLAGSRDPTVRAWVESYRRRHHAEPDHHAVAYYDGVHLLAQTLGRASSTTPQVVRDALLATKNYPGLLFPYTFDEHGDGVHRVVISRYRGLDVDVLETVWEAGFAA